WKRTGSMAHGHERHTADRLSDGRVVVVGDTNLNTSNNTKAEAYNETWGTWAPLADYPYVGGVFGQVSVLNGSTLLLAGGQGATTSIPNSRTAQLDTTRVATTMTEYKLPAAVDPDVLADVATEQWAAVYRPAALDPSTRYPVLLFMHGNHQTCPTDCNTTD